MDLESLRSNGGLKLQDVEKMSNFFAIFGKKDSLRKNFLNSFPKAFIATPINVLCSNFVIFGGETLLLTEQKPYFAWLSSYRYCAYLAKNTLGLANDKVVRVLQISSKSGRCGHTCT